MSPPPRPDDQRELPDFNFDGFSDEFEFDEWREVFIANTDAEVVEEHARWGSKEQFQDDPEMAVILAAFNRQRCRRIQEQVLVETNVINFEHVVKISHERVPWRRQATSSWRLSSRACLSSMLNARPRWPPASK
jgi:hypothetical protein